MAVPLKDIVDHNTLLEDGHVFMGFSKDGQFVISYTLVLDFGEDSAMPCYSYKLHWWKFRDRQPMVKVSEIQLFAEEKISLALHLAVCSWPTDDTKILVYGCASCKPTPDEKLACYVTITAVPQYSPCPTCTNIKHSGDYHRPGRDADMPFGDIPPELADEFGPVSFVEPPPPCCLKHSYAVHTRFEMSPPFPGFSPIHSMRKDGVVVLNSGDTLIALSVNLCKVSDAVFSPSAGRFSFKDTPRKSESRNKPPRRTLSNGDFHSTMEQLQSCESPSDGRCGDSLGSSEFEFAKKTKSIQKVQLRLRKCHHRAEEGGHKPTPRESRDMLDMLDEGDKGKQTVESCSIQSVFEAGCQTCRLCQEITHVTGTKPEANQECSIDSSTEPCVFESASHRQDGDDLALDHLTSPCNLSDYISSGGEDDFRHPLGEAEPLSEEREHVLESRQSPRSGGGKCEFGNGNESARSYQGFPEAAKSGRQSPLCNSDLCNISGTSCTPIANGIFQNLHRAERTGGLTFAFDAASQTSDGKSSIGSELDGTCPYHCPDFDDTQSSNATIKDCTCNMQRIFYALRRFVEKGSIENNGNVDHDNYGPDYHNMVPIHVTGPYDLASLKKSSKASPEDPCIEVRQITLDAEHYICDAICKRATWGKRYISFTDYDMNILDVCPDSSTVYVLLKALVRAWPESKTSVDIFEFDDNPTSDTPEVFETGFSFAWNLKTGTYETLHIEDLVPFDQSQLIKMWNPGFLRTLQLQRKAALPQNHSNSVHILTNEAVFKNKSLTRLLDPVHYVAIILT
ncbi:DDB1- and CUL4-associated factor 15-like isoform X2 [Apostichopus japonicus]